MCSSDLVYTPEREVWKARQETLIANCMAQKGYVNADPSVRGVVLHVLPELADPALVDHHCSAAVCGRCCCRVTGCAVRHVEVLEGGAEGEREFVGTGGGFSLAGGGAVDVDGALKAVVAALKRHPGDASVVRRAAGGAVVRARACGGRRGRARGSERVRECGAFCRR